LLYWKNVVQSK